MLFLKLIKKNVDFEKSLCYNDDENVRKENKRWVKKWQQTLKALWEYTHTHTHTHTSSLEINKKESINTLRNIKEIIRNKINKKSRTIISCGYIDTGWYYLLFVMEKNSNYK